MISSIRAFVVAIITQQARDKTSLFFMVALPIGIITIIGATFGGAQDIEIAVVGPDESSAVDDLVSRLDAVEDLSAVHIVDIEQARGDIRRFDIEAAVVVQDDGTLGVITNAANGQGFAARSAIQRVVDGGAAAEASSAVVVESVGEARFATQGAFALTSAQNLVLFTFITSLTASVILVRIRTNGVLRRSLAAPAGVGAITLGVGAGWLVLALIQTLIIVALGALAFGVDWGDPIAAIVLIMVFGLVGTGAGLLVGSLFPTEDTASSATPPIALVLAALGGCMVPSEVFPPVLQTISRLTPHYWAVEGWKKLMFDGAGLAGVATELGVLAAFAVVLIGLANMTLRRSLSGLG